MIRSLYLKNLQNHGREIARFVHEQHWRNSPIRDANEWLLILNTLTAAAEIDWINLTNKPYCFLAQSSWILLVRTLPSRVTSINLNDLMIDGDALMDALISTQNAAILRKLKLRRSRLTSAGLAHLQSLPSLEVLDIAFCEIPGAVEMIALNCRELSKLSVGFFVPINAHGAGAAPLNEQYASKYCSDIICSLNLAFDADIWRF